MCASTHGMVGQGFPPLQIDVLEKNEKIAFLEGNWVLEVTRYSREGNPTKTLNSTVSFKPVLGGLLYSGTYKGDISGEEKEVIQNWIFYNKIEKEFFDVSIFEFFREIGDVTKTYGVALVYIKEGKENADQFAAYHQEACEIIPEFGTHFERFLIPFASANDEIKQPSEIHRFYFDSQKRMQNMVTDKRIQALFPKRDASLENLIFIIREAIQ